MKWSITNHWCIITYTQEQKVHKSIFHSERKLECSEEFKAEALGEELLRS